MNLKKIIFFVVLLSFTSFVNAQSIKIKTINNLSVTDFIDSRTLANTVIEAGEILTLNLQYSKIGDGFNPPKVSVRFLTKEYRVIKGTKLTKTLEFSSENKNISIQIKVPYSENHDFKDIKLQVYIQGAIKNKLMEYVNHLNVL